MLPINFEILLTAATTISGIIYLLDVLVFARRRALNQRMPLIIDYARSFFPVLLLVLIIRSFIVEPFRIPSGSERPELLVGDFIVANKFIYGLRLPVWHKKIFEFKEPKRGDIVVFLWPHDHETYFIKRIIGLPGDQISYQDKVLSINGKPATQSSEGQAQDQDDSGKTTWPVAVKRENLEGRLHNIYLNPDYPAGDFSVVVPKDQYFVMGDNRDNSYDSRYWGFVPEKNLVGKAMWVFFSWDSTDYRIRWQRIGHAL
jgi:signal peptidase I